jgi:pimeloyl-ACP methyl ester carboxylesterase
MDIENTTQMVNENGFALHEPVARFSTNSVISADGTRIGYRQIGSGPGILVLHGGSRASQHYMALAQALAGSYTVYIPDRRGRGLSGAPGKEYSLDREMEDVRAMLHKTGASRMFGHSAGGFFALEAALRMPIQKLALYEPAVSINGSMPLDWIGKFEKALAKNDPATAFALMVKGLRLNTIGHLPVWGLSPFARLMMRGEEGQEMAELLPTMVWEVHEFQRLEQGGLTYERYQNIAAKTLLLGGSRSPDYLLKAVRTLTSTIPHARSMELPGLDHNAPDQNAPDVVALKLMQFFL